MSEVRWPNARSFTREQLRVAAVLLRQAGYDVHTKDLDPYAINIVRSVAGSNPDDVRKVQRILERVMG